MTARQESKPRRPRGDGGVYWDERRQRWIAEKTVGYDGRGKRIVRKASGKSESAALRSLAKRVRDYETGLVLGSEHYKVKQAVEDWLDHGHGDVDDSTRERNRNMCETHILPMLGGRKLRELQATEVDAWLEDRATVLATSSLRRLKWCLSRSVARAMKRGLVERNVVDLCELPRGQNGRRSKSLTMEQAKGLLTATRKDPLHCYIVVSLLTGARTEELRALRWEHVHLDTVPARIEVWRSVRSGGDTKTQKSRRTLALPRLAVDRLKQHKKRQLHDRLRTEVWVDPGLVFPSQVGTEMDAANVRRAFRRALKLVPGIDPNEWTPRELRHSFVSLLSASGVDIEDIADLVGHKGTHVTELVYRHQLRPVIQTGTTVMDALFPIEWAKGSEDA